MNQPPEEFKRIPAEQLRSFGSACLQAAGMTDQHAAQLADLLTNSDLRGVRSHGPVWLYRGYAPAAAGQGLIMLLQMPIIEELRRLLGVAAI